MAVLATAAVAHVGRGAPDAVAAPTAGSDDFYVPPSPLPAGRPGDVVRSRPSHAGPPRAIAAADAWQVMYLSTNALGQPVAMTATVVVPKAARAGARPIVALAPGTHGPAFRCTPSRMIDSGSFYEQPALNDMIDDGYAVVVPDYEGARPGGRPTYVTGAAMGAAVLDGVRAAQRLGVGLAADAPVVVRGYSQGGGASMWAGQMQPTYAPEVRLVGVAGGGVPADPIQLAIGLDGQVGFGVLAYALIGFDAAYPELRLDDHLNANGHAVFDQIRSDACVLELLRDHQGQRLNDMFTTSPILEPAWQARYRENTLGQAPIPVPVLLFQSTTDPLVGPAQAATLRSTYCGRGMAVTWRAYDPGVTGLPGHTHLVYGANADVRTFIADRFANRPPTPNC